MLSLTNVSFTYPNSSLPVLQNISFEVSGVCAVLGPSGCGKSTMIKLCAGILTPDAGNVLLYGKPINPKEINVGLIPQDGGLLPWLTVEENTALGQKIKHQNNKAKVSQVLERLGILALKDCYPGQISGGQKQRVTVARALCMDPSLLLMDEPFSALDANTREEAQDFLREITKHNYNITTLIVTHSVEEAAVLGTNILVMKKGRIIKILKNPLKGYNEPRRQNCFYELCDSLRCTMKDKQDVI